MNIRIIENTSFSKSISIDDISLKYRGPLGNQIAKYSPDTKPRKRRNNRATHGKSNNKK